MNELWPLYDEHGEQIDGQDADPEDVLTRGLLHGASHVWIWRKTPAGVEVLVQKRADTKRTWPGLYDISAAGHIDSGETPIVAALREAKEEINLDIEPARLKLFSVMRIHMVSSTGLIENEFQWLYLLRMDEKVSFELQEYEVDSLKWVSLESFVTDSSGSSYVPHGETYYAAVGDAIRRELQKTNG